MKKVTFIVLLAVLTNLSMFAQGYHPTKALIDKYHSQKGITLASVSKELFNHLLELGQESEIKEINEVRDVIKDIDFLHVMMFDLRRENNPQMFEQFKNDLENLKLDGYSELMTVQETDETVKFFTKKNGEEINELLLLIFEPQQAGFISITGKINLRSIGRISRTMNLQGLENLEKINKSEKK